MLDDVSEELTKIPEVMSLYEVTGSADLVALIKCPSILLFRNLLVGNVMKIDGVRNIISSVVLSATKPQHLQS
jgi:DNA-binding Lrp family transcriptional regulator